VLVAPLQFSGRAWEPAFEVTTRTVRRPAAASEPAPQGTES
jgi:hypothetical protein